MDAYASGPAATIRVRSLQPQRRRAGMLFTREPRDLSPADFADGVEGGEQILAILRDPQLAVELVDEDGTAGPVSDDVIEQLAEAVSLAGDLLAGVPAHVEPIAPPPVDAPTEPAAAPAPDAAPATVPDDAPVTEAAAEPAAKPKPAPAAKKPSGRTRGKPAAPAKE